MHESVFLFCAVKLWSTVTVALAAQWVLLLQLFADLQ